MKQMDMELTIHNARLNKSQLAEALQSHRNDFTPPLTDDFIENYSCKWSEHAEHIYCTDKEGNMRALMVYYANRLPFIYTTHIWIERSYRQKGYCPELFSYAEHLSSEKGFTEHWLEVADDNTGARAAYEKYGFKLFEKRPRSSILKKEIF